MHESACPLAGLVPVMHVVTAKWITMFPQGPRELQITIYVGLLIFSLVFFVVVVFFYIYCFLKINIVCVPRKFTDKPDCVFFLESWLLCLLSIPLLLFFFLEWSIHIIMRSSTTFLLKSRLKPSNDLSGITGLSAWPSWSSAGFAGVTGCPSGKYSKPL